MYSFFSFTYIYIYMYIFTYSWIRDYKATLFFWRGSTASRDTQFPHIAFHNHTCSLNAILQKKGIAIYSLDYQSAGFIDQGMLYPVKLIK